MRRAPNRNLTYAILEELGQAIVTGAYGRNGGFPIEAQLCKQFGASRSVLREAVKMLTAKGLLSARPRQGTWIEPESRWNLLDPDVLRWLLERKFSLQLLTEFTQMRFAIEPMAAAMAARYATPELLQPMHAAIERMRAAERGDDDPLESDIAFHVGMLRACGNRFFEQLEDLIETALRFSIRLTNQTKGVALASVADHKRVLDAIEGHNPERARAAMEAILREVMELIAVAEKESKAGTSTRSGAARRSA